MADITIAGLPAGSGAIDDTSLLHTSEGGIDKKRTFADFVSRVFGKFNAFIQLFIAATSAAAARVVLEVDKKTTFSNADYTILTTDTYVPQIGTMSVARTVTLPAANAVNAGKQIIVADASGTVTTTNKITVQRAGSDVIDGVASKEILNAYGSLTFISDGVSAWKLIANDANPVGTSIMMSANVVPPGYVAENAQAISRITYPALFALYTAGFTSQTFTVTLASPGVFTKSSHGFFGGERIRLSTTGALPTGLSTSVDYFVIYVDANTFQVSTTFGGSAVNTSGGQSGTHSYLQSLYGLGDGSTTFNVDDSRNYFFRGLPSSGRQIGTKQLDQFQGHYHNPLPPSTSFIGDNGGGLTGAGNNLNMATTGSPVTDGVNGTPRTGSETRPMNATRLFCVKY